jgi:hypothetical protein
MPREILRNDDRLEQLEQDLAGLECKPTEMASSVVARRLLR